MRTHNLDTQSGHIRVSTPDFEQNRGRRKFGNSTAKASLQAVAAAVSSKLHNTAARADSNAHGVGLWPHVWSGRRHCKGEYR